MSGSNRERQAIAAVACPMCGATIGELCHVARKTIAASPGRPIIHTERRHAWHEWKRMLADDDLRKGGPR